MDVLLIYPPSVDYDKSNFIKRITSPYASYRSAPPLGIASIAGYLRTKGLDVGILDMEVERAGFSFLKNYIRSCEPKMVGISVMSPLFVRARSICEMIKETFKSSAGDIVTFAGGAHANTKPETLLTDAPFDYVVRGDGEYITHELFDAVMNKSGDVSGISGISYRENGKIKHQGEISVIKDLDGLPLPARDLLKNGKYFSILAKNNPCTSIVTSRGCPFSCSFCAQVSNNNVFRQRDFARVVDEMEWVVKDFGIKDFEIFDGTFNANRRWVLKFCRELSDRKLETSWRVRCRTELFDEDTACAMKEAGCQVVSLGIEAATEKTLAFYRKPTSIEIIEDKIRIIKKAGIEIYAFFMLGAPVEGMADMRKTIEFARKHHFDYASFAILTPFPGSEFYDMSIEKGWLVDKNVIDSKVQLDSLNEATFNHPELSSEEMSKAYKLAYRRFYLNPKWFFKFFLKVLKDPLRYIKGFYFTLKNAV